MPPRFLRIRLRSAIFLGFVSISISSFSLSSKTAYLTVTQQSSPKAQNLRVCFGNLYASNYDFEPSNSDNSKHEGGENNEDTDHDSPAQYRRRIRRRVADLARNLVVKPIVMPQAVAAVLKDATMQAVDMAVDEVLRRQDENNNNNLDGSRRNSKNAKFKSDNDVSNSSPEPKRVDLTIVIDEAFAPLEKTLTELEEKLKESRKMLVKAKNDALYAVQAVHAAALAQAEGTSIAIAAAEEAASQQIMQNLLNNNSNNSSSQGSTDNDSDEVEPSPATSTLSFDEVDFDSSEMAPPFLDEDSCLVPGEPVARVEKAPENSRRIFAGIDIMASVDDVWKLLTDYDNLQNVIPNLVVNKVLERYDGHPDVTWINLTRSDDEVLQCKQLSMKMKGAKLKQVGGAKVAGINFSARTTLEVREWPQGLPDVAHFNDEIWQGQSRQQRAKAYATVKLQRYRFPRPFAISSLPTRDISMQSVENDDGEFRLYQGVWRMQPLPGCAPPGQQAMRLTYAVEISPRAFLPVRLVEGRIVQDLCTNLEAIRDYVAKSKATTA